MERIIAVYGIAFVGSLLFAEDDKEVIPWFAAFFLIVVVLLWRFRVSLQRRDI